MGPTGRLWKGICKEREVFEEWGVHFQVGKGDRVRFLLDPWCGPSPLYHAFPDLFAKAMLKNGLVKEHLKRENGSGITTSTQVNFDLPLVLLIPSICTISLLIIGVVIGLCCT